MADLGRVPPPDPTGTGTPVALVPPPLTRIPVRPGDVFLEPGYVLEPVAAGFTYPTDLEWDERGRLHVVEAGYSYGPAKAAASGRVLRIEEDGSVVEVAAGFRPPVTGIAFLDGFLYVAEGGNPGRITRVAPDGSRRVIVDGLRSGADHFTGELVAGPDGRLYFGVGTATNSAVVGVDNFVFGWLPDLPSFHDVPARDLVLRGINFATVDPLASPVPGGPLLGTRAVTGAYHPFGAPSTPGEVVEGQLLANGAIYRVNPDGSGLEVFADGLRNPFGLGFAPDGRLLAIDQGYDARGNRPVFNALEPLWVIQRGGWYGWPDFVAGIPVTNPRFRPEGPVPPPGFLLAEHPPLAGPLLAVFPRQAATMKFDFATNPAFGFPGEMFIAMFGTGAPATHPDVIATGFRVVRLNLATGALRSFLVNLRPGPEGTGVERPIDVRFDPAGETLYVLDFGVVEANAAGIIPWAQSGILWRIRRQAG